MLRKLGNIYMCIYIRHGTYIRHVMKIQIHTWMHICLSTELMDISKTYSQHSDQEETIASTHILSLVFLYGNWAPLDKYYPHFWWHALTLTAFELHECNHTVCTHLCLISFVQQFVSVTVDCSFLILPSTFYYLSIWMLIDIRVVASVWPFQVMLLQTF